MAMEFIMLGADLHKLLNLTKGSDQNEDISALSLCSLAIQQQRTHTTTLSYQVTEVYVEEICRFTNRLFKSSLFSFNLYCRLVVHECFYVPYNFTR